MFDPQTMFLLQYEVEFNPIKSLKLLHCYKNNNISHVVVHCIGNDRNILKFYCIHKEKRIK